MRKEGKEKQREKTRDQKKRKGKKRKEEKREKKKKSKKMRRHKERVWLLESLSLALAALSKKSTFHHDHKVAQHQVVQCSSAQT